MSALAKAGAHQQKRDVLDYSRWDDLECSDDEIDGHKGATAGPHRPVVTRLEKPSTITFGGMSHSDPQSAAQSTPLFTRSGADQHTASSTTEDSDSSCLNAKTRADGAKRSSESHLRSKSRKEPVSLHMRRNGAKTSTHWWSQTKNEVIIRFKVPHSVKARDVKLCVRERSLEFSINGKNQLMQGSALHLPVKAVDDSIDIDWEIERGTMSNKEENITFVRLTLEKKLVPGVVMWWDRVFQHEESPQLDVSGIGAREGKSMQSGDAGKSRGLASKSKSQKVWEEAHALFRQRVQERHNAQPQII